MRARARQTRVIHGPVLPVRWRREHKFGREPGDSPIRANFVSSTYPVTLYDRAMAGAAALGRLDDATLRQFAGSNQIRTGFALDSEPWHVSGVTCVGVVADDQSHAAAIDAALRGADIAVDVVAERAARFSADLRRAGIETWEPPVGEPSQPDWGPLLDALTAGESVQEAARRCHVSLRTAHRRLAEAREHFGVTSNAAALAQWSARRPSPTRD